MTTFQPILSSRRRVGTGCIGQISDHLYEGRYSPRWIDGKKHARNVYAHTREECEEKLKALIAEMKAELAELKARKGRGVGALPQKSKSSGSMPAASRTSRRLSSSIKRSSS